MSQEGVDEYARNKILAVCQQLERMSLSQFEELLSPLFERDDYNTAADAVKIYLGIDDDWGIVTARYSYLRAYDGNVPIEEGHSGEFETKEIGSGSWQIPANLDAMWPLGPDMLQFVHPASFELDSARLMQSLYEALMAIMSSSTPSTYTMNSTLEIELYHHDSQNIDISEVHGEPWEAPDPEDLEPDEELQIQKIPKTALPGVIEEIDVRVPTDDLTCSNLYDKCKHVEDLPDNVGPRKEREHRRKQDDQRRLDPGTTVRAVAVITRDRHREREEWDIPDIWHVGCAPSIEEFQTNYSTFGSIGKDEVLVEGEVEAGDIRETNLGSHQEMYITGAKVLARKGEFANLD